MSKPSPVSLASPVIIAIDGHAASGKGTLARRIASHYGLAYLDSGKLYRLVAYGLLADNLPLTEASAAAYAAQFSEAIPFALMDDKRLLQADVSEAAMVVAAFADVRAALKAAQQAFAAHPYHKGKPAKGAVIDGRDIGTVICPRAPVKLFVTADVEVRAERRLRDLTEASGEGASYEQVLSDLRKRDEADENREHAPLRRAADAVEINTSAASVEQSLKQCLAVIDKMINGRLS